MYKHIIKMECLTGLHVGSGDVNYNIIDNEVERDPINGRPVINSSGVKGAFRDAYIIAGGSDTKRIFGSEGKGDDFTTGTYKFLTAELIYRPLRASNSGSASVPATTIDTINDFLRKLNGFGINPFGVDSIQYDKDFSILSADGKVLVEGEDSQAIPQQLADQLAKLNAILPENLVIVRNFDDYPLPVIARNHLENGKSVNLWYEEYVPQTSLFYTVILSDEEDLDSALGIGSVVQFGGHNSIGYGYMKLEELK